MMYRVRHTTTYAYTSAVSVSHNVLHLTPRECQHQRCPMHELLIYPKPAFINQAEDYFGNPVTYFGLQEPHEALTMTANSTVEVTPVDWPQPRDTPPWELVRKQLRQDCSRDGLDAYQFVFDSPYVPTGKAVMHLAAPFFSPDRPLLEAVCDFMHYIYTEFTYDPDATSVSTPIDDVIAQRHGVLPRLCPSANRRPTVLRIGRTLREWLSRHATAGRARTARRGLGLACLVVRVLPGGGLDRCRSDQRCVAG